jgi:hypothetical protein
MMTLLDVSLSTRLFLSIIVDLLWLAAIVAFVWKFWPLISEFFTALMGAITAFFRTAKVDGKKVKVEVVKPKGDKS